MEINAGAGLSFGACRSGKEYGRWRGRLKVQKLA
jgi:hypothetical protein